MCIAEMLPWDASWAMLDKAETYDNMLLVHLLDTPTHFAFCIESVRLSDLPPPRSAREQRQLSFCPTTGIIFLAFGSNFQVWKKGTQAPTKIWHLNRRPTGMRARFHPAAPLPENWQGNSANTPVLQQLTLRLTHPYAYRSIWNQRFLAPSHCSSLNSLAK